MSINIIESLNEIFDAYRNKKSNLASELLQNFTSHFIITSQAEIEKVFSIESLTIIFEFLSESPSFISLNLLSFLQLFTDNFNAVSDFVNQKLDIFVKGFQHIENQEILQFYQFTIQYIQPTSFTIYNLTSKLFDLVIFSEQVSFYKYAGELIQQLIQLIINNQPLPIFLEHFMEFFKSWSIQHLFGFSEIVPRILRICLCNEAIMAIQVQQLVLVQIQELLTYCCDPICSSYDNYKIHFYLHNILEYAYVDQNIAFYNQLDEMSFFQTLFKKSQGSDSHSISFTRNMGHFYIQVRQRLPLTSQLLDDGSNQARQIMFSSQVKNAVSRVAKSTNEKDFLTYTQFNGLIPIKFRTSYISLLISILKEFYVDLLSQQWRYGELFEKTEGNRQLKRFSLDDQLYEAVQDFIRFFLIPSKAALKMFNSELFLQEQFGGQYLINIVSQNMQENEVSDEFIEDAWAGVQDIGIKPLHLNKKRPKKSLSQQKEGNKLRSQKLEGEMQIPTKQFNFDLAQLQDGQMLQKFGKKSKTPKAMQLHVNNNHQSNLLRKQSQFTSNNKLSIHIGPTSISGQSSEDSSLLFSSRVKLKPVDQKQKLSLKINNFDSEVEESVFNTLQSLESDESSIDPNQFDQLRPQVKVHWRETSFGDKKIHSCLNSDDSEDMKRLNINVGKQVIQKKNSSGRLNQLMQCSDSEEDKMIFKPATQLKRSNQFHDNSSSDEMPQKLSINIGKKQNTQNILLQNTQKSQTFILNDDYRLSQAVVALSDDYSMDMDFDIKPKNKNISNFESSSSSNMLNLSLNIGFKQNNQHQQMQGFKNTVNQDSSSDDTKLSININKQPSNSLSLKLLKSKDNSSSENQNKMSLKIQPTSNNISYNDLDIFNLVNQPQLSLKSESSSNKRLKYEDDEFALEGSDS